MLKKTCPNNSIKIFCILTDIYVIKSTASLKITILGVLRLGEALNRFDIFSVWTTLLPVINLQLISLKCFANLSILS